MMAAPAIAQTVITADVANGVGTGTVVTNVGDETTISGGTIAGSNLFHSFLQFDLAQGDLAQWVRSAPDAASIANIVNRVTGGDPSHIDGTLRVADMPNADFWFLNPAGIIFGEGAVLDVPGAMYFSTAEVLRFVDGGVFSIATPSGSTFSAAQPEAFGFLGGQGGIALAAVGESITSATSKLSLSASDIQVSGSFQTGSLDAVALGDAVIDVPTAGLALPPEAGSIDILGSENLPVILATNANLSAGEIRISGVILQAIASEPGPAGITVRAGTLAIDSALLSTATDTSQDAGPVTIDVNSLSLSNAGFQSFTNAEGSAGDVRIAAQSVALTNGSLISSDTFGSGTAGEVALFTDMLALRGSRILSTAGSDGDAGRISIEAGTIDLAEGSSISSQNESGSNGDAGQITITAEALRADFSAIDTSTFAAGNAGSIAIVAQSLELTGESRIESAADALASGDAGTVLIEADDLHVDFSQIETSSFGSGNAGRLVIRGLNGTRASRIRLEDAGRFASTTGGSGQSGTIEIDAISFELDNLALVSTASIVGGSGKGGAIRIAADTLSLNDFSSIFSGAVSTGDGGTIEIEAGSISLSDFSEVASGSFAGSSGNAGSVAIAADTLSLDAGKITSATNGAGDAGSLALIVRDIALANDSFITSQAEDGSSGNAGSVLIDAETLAVDASEIASSTFSSGHAGSVTVLAREIALTDGGGLLSQANSGASGNAGSVIVESDALDLMDGRISASTAGPGKGGDVILRTNALTADDAIIASATLGEGNAGSIVIRPRPSDDPTASTIRLSGASLVSSLTSQSGDAGTVDIEAGSIVLSEVSSLDSMSLSGATGSAGDVFVRAGSLVVLDSFVTSRTRGAGDAGNVFLDLDTLRTGDAEISSSTSGDGNAGAVAIRAHAIELSDDTDLTSQANTGSTGAGGEILILTDSLLVDASQVSSATRGSGNAGSVTVRPYDGATSGTNRIVLDNAAYISSFTGDSGNAGLVDVVAGTIELGEATSIDSQTLTGASGKGGDVLVSAQEVSIMGGFIDSSTLGTGRGGDVVVEVAELRLTGGQVSSSTFGTGNAGSVTIRADAIELADGAFLVSQSDLGATGDAGSLLIETASLVSDASNISTGTLGSGDAGSLTILAGDPASAESGRIVLRNSGYASSFTAGDGDAGSVQVSAGTVEVRDGASLDSEVLEGAAGDAGGVIVVANRLVVDGGIVSTATRGSGASGSVRIAALSVDVLDGGEISTDAEFGAAGDIFLLFPREGQLRVSGVLPAVITTSSGTNTGGRITIAQPYLILSDGGSILALGEVSGANVQITSDYFLRSADRLNLLSVNGDLVLDSQFSDLSAGTEAPDINFLDASAVLSSQCATIRATGQTSHLTSRITGPYASGIPAQQKVAADQRPLSIERVAPCG